MGGGGRTDESAGKEVLSPSGIGKNRRRNPKIIIIVHKVVSDKKLVMFAGQIFQQNEIYEILNSFL